MTFNRICFIVNTPLHETIAHEMIKNSGIECDVVKVNAVTRTEKLQEYVIQKITGFEKKVSKGLMTRKSQINFTQKPIGDFKDTLFINLGNYNINLDQSGNNKMIRITALTGKTERDCRIGNLVWKEPGVTIRLNSYLVTPSGQTYIRSYVTSNNNSLLIPRLNNLAAALYDLVYYSVIKAKQS